jgi:hypoxanthine phosphoribosyltransferase
MLGFENEKLSTLIDEASLQARIAELGVQLRKDHGDAPITCIGVLKGSFLFMADLIRAIEGPVRCEFLGVSSYEGGTRSTGVVKITQDLKQSIEGQHCILIEDIVDTGLTMEYLLRMLRLRNPASLRVASLLDKPSNRQVEVEIDYVGFTIPDEFVVGYGLDLQGFYRNLPYIAVYQP